MLSHPRGPLTGINYYVGPAKSATSHEKLKDQLEKNIAYFSEFSPNLGSFHAFHFLSLFSDKLYELRELNVSFYCHCHCFCCSCGPLFLFLATFLYYLVGILFL